MQPRAQLQLGSQVSMFLSENVDLRRQRPNCLFTIAVSQLVPPASPLYQSSGTRKVGSGYPTDSTCLYLGLRGQYFEFVHGSIATGSVPLILALRVRPFWVWGPSSAVGLTSLMLRVLRTFGTTVSIAGLVSPVRSEGALCECHELKANFDADLSQSCVLCIQDS